MKRQLPASAAAASSAAADCDKAARRRTTKLSLDQAIHRPHKTFVGSKTNDVARLMGSKRPQYALSAWTRKHLQLFTPKTSVSLKRNQQGTLNPDKPGSDHRHQLQKADEVAEAAQRKAT